MFLKKGKTSTNDKFDLPSQALAPPAPQMKAFEEDLLKLTSNISFTKVNDPFLSKIGDDMKEIQKSNSVYVFADKSTKVYATTVDNYNKLLHENVTKTCKMAEENVTDNINEELQSISNTLGISNRIDITAQRNAYLTLKDHKENFQSNAKFRVVELGKVSKIVLDEIDSSIREKSKINH